MTFRICWSALGVCCGALPIDASGQARLPQKRPHLPAAVTELAGLALVAMLIAALVVTPAATRSSGAGKARDLSGGISGLLVGERALAGLPIAAQGAISRVLGSDERAYHVAGSTDRLALSNAEHRLVARFSERGVDVMSDAARLGFALRAWGYGNALRPVRAAAPQGVGNVVTYRRGVLTEWYANGPLGLEQGFAVHAPPSTYAPGPLTFAIALRSDGRAYLATRRDLKFVGSSLRYSGLVATDARGRDLPAWLALRGRTLLLQVDDRGARYPLEIDPFIQQAKLTASDGAEGDRLGRSVAVAGDTVVVGAPEDDEGANADQGSAYVFVRPASGWANVSEHAKLTASDGQSLDRFGESVAVTSDTVVVGAPGNPFGGVGRGGAYIFVKSETGWASGTEQAKLTAADGEEGDGLGFSVGISGSVVVAGAPFNDIAANSDQGAVYVFVRPTAGWANATEQARLAASDGTAGDELGFSVAASDDVVVAGALLDDVLGNENQGSAYVYVEPATGWSATTEQAKLTASDGSPNDVFGISVAADGDTVVVGSPFDDIGANDGQGSAYLFTKPDTGWASMTEEAKLIASDGAQSDELGRSVAISGNTVVAGVAFDCCGGSAHVFVKSASGWASGIQEARLRALDAANSDGFGLSVAVSHDTIVVGAPFDDAGGVNTDEGSAYVFVRAADVAPPTIACHATPATLWPPSHELRSVSVDVSAADDSGSVAVTLLSAISNQADSGLGREDVPSDIEDWTVGTDDRTGAFRAERFHEARTYTLTYQAEDPAGNTAICQTSVVVPKNQAPS